MSVEIYIARHGQNEDNKNGILNGHRDLPLTELGRQQAKELAAGIKEVGLTFNEIYSSPLARAYETAEIVAHAIRYASKPKILPELIERNFGVMTGKSIADIEELCAPDIIKTEGITYFLKPEGAETFPDLVARGDIILQKIKSLHAKGRVLLVCHGDIGKMVYVAATGKDWVSVLSDFHFGNCDLIEVESKRSAHKIKLPQHNL